MQTRLQLGSSGQRNVIASSEADKAEQVLHGRGGDAVPAKEAHDPTVAGSVAEVAWPGSISQNKIPRVDCLMRNRRGSRHLAAFIP